MKMLLAMMLVLALPLLLVADDGWRTWEKTKPVATATRSASTIDWLPEPKVEHPMAKAMNEEGFPPRSAALAVKEKEAVKASVAAQPPKVETPAVEAPQYIDVPLYDRRGRQVGTERRQVVPQSPQAFLTGDSDTTCTTNSSGVVS